MHAKPQLYGFWRVGRVKDFEVRLPPPINLHSTSGHAGRFLNPQPRLGASRAAAAF